MCDQGVQIQTSLTLWTRPDATRTHTRSPTPQVTAAGQASTSVCGGKCWCRYWRTMPVTETGRICRVPSGRRISCSGCSGRRGRRTRSDRDWPLAWIDRIHQTSPMIARSVEPIDAARCAARAAATAGRAPIPNRRAGEASRVALEARNAAWARASRAGRDHDDGPGVGGRSVGPSRHWRREQAVVDQQLEPLDHRPRPGTSRGRVDRGHPQLRDGLARAATAAGLTVVECEQPHRKTRRTRQIRPHRRASRGARRAASGCRSATHPARRW